jgi:adenylate cyclase
MRVLSSLQTKLTAGFLVLVLAVTGLTFAFTFRQARQALREVTQTELVALASVVADGLCGADGDLLGSLRPGDEGSAAFLALRDKLRRIRAAHPDIRYLYTMRRAGEGATFVVDADYGSAEDPGAAIDEPYEEINGRLLEGFDRPSADEEFTTDRWGTLLSGYAPVRDSAGRVVALVGVDMASDRVLEKQAFIGQSILWVSGAGLALAVGLVLLFSQTIIKDLKRMIQAATSVSMGSLEVEIEVRRRDEIGDLAEAFSRMVTSLKILMAAERQA